MGFHRKHWSYSAINQYLRCPLQYYFERVLRLPKPTVGSGLVLGEVIDVEQILGESIDVYDLSKRDAGIVLDTLTEKQEAKPNGH